MCYFEATFEGKQHPTCLVVFFLVPSGFLDIIEESGPLTGYGMFQITRGLLTSMISTSITYLIVSVQFKMPYV